MTTYSIDVTPIPAAATTRPTSTSGRLMKNIIIEKY